MVESHPVLQPALIGWMAKFTKIRARNFGMQCYNFLARFSNVSFDLNLRNCIKKSIKDDILSRIESHKIQEYQEESLIELRTLLKGLTILINSSEMAALFSEEHVELMAQWIEDYEISQQQESGDIFEDIFK